MIEVHTNPSVKPRTATRYTFVSGKKTEKETITVVLTNAPATFDGQLGYQLKMRISQNELANRPEPKDVFVIDDMNYKIVGDVTLQDNNVAFVPFWSFFVTTV